MKPIKDWSDDSKSWLIFFMVIGLAILSLAGTVLAYPVDNYSFFDGLRFCAGFLVSSFSVMTMWILIKIENKIGGNHE